jgi:hypothetical protein
MYHSEKTTLKEYIVLVAMVIFSGIVVVFLNSIAGNPLENHPVIMGISAVIMLVILMGVIAC